MSAEDVFCTWLTKKLKQLQIDDDVFVNYIVGILTSEETESEKQENLQDILNGFGTCDVPSLCSEIFAEWQRAEEETEQAKEKITKNEKQNRDVKLAFIMEKQAQSVSKQNVSESEKKLKEAILAQYSQVSEDEEEEDGVKNSFNGTLSSSGLAPNENAVTVINAEKELREKSKAESEEKRAQDKLNKEKQKQKQQERREKERKRTQKSEHRR